MNLEQPEKPMESPLKRGDRIQIELVRKFYGFEPHNTELFKWIEEHAVKFRELLRETPKILTDYDTDPEKTLAELEEKLYEKHPHDEEV